MRMKKPLRKKTPGSSLPFPAQPEFNELSANREERQSIVPDSLLHSELRYRRLFESAQDGILILEAESGAITDVNPYLVNLLGYSREELLHKTLCEVGAFKDMAACKKAYKVLKSKKFIRYDDLPLKTREGRLIPVEFVSNVYMVGNEKVVQCNIRDITARKLAEAELRTKEEAHKLLFEHLPAGVMVHAPDTRVVLCNSEAGRLLGMPREQMVGKSYDDPAWHFFRENGSKMPAEEFPVNRVLTTGEALKNLVLGVYRNNDTQLSWLLVNAYPETKKRGQLYQIVMIFTEITAIKRAQERIRVQLEHLIALSEIDRAITSSFDLRFSLSTLLSHLVTQLKVDAAGVLLFNATSQNLEFAVQHGFSSKAYEHTRLRLGEGYAGRAALERKMAHFPDLEGTESKFQREKTLVEDEFITYYGLPLVAKGQLKGMLEVFHRTPLAPDDEWLDFLKALAGQAAIAIDNATLFDSLQRSNAELALAYDSTIEGWSHALDLRDKETEGHTQRVAELTVKLAHIFGFSDSECVQIRWGALLHDIGKMAVPDGILLKEGELTESEWQIMKKHPEFAHEMLSPILYLRSALDIPYRHHERWDGTGYPMGLKGEQIPLSARIFSVVDTWDALCSDRPYRPAWPAKKVRKHLRLLAGTHFDPHVVDVCLKSKIFTGGTR